MLWLKIYTVTPDPHSTFELVVAVSGIMALHHHQTLRITFA
jgi:hypothetical protein